MFRMYFLTFEGEFRGENKTIQKQLLKDAGIVSIEGDHSHHDHEPHESPLTMTFPLMALAVPSVLIGLLGVPWNNKFEAFVFSPNETAEEVIKQAAEHFSWNEFLIMGGLSVAISQRHEVIAVVGIIVSYLAYMQGKIDVRAIAEKYPALYQFSLKKWYFDELYNTVFVRGCRRVARQILEIDYRVVDGAVNLTGLVTIISGEGLKYFEIGANQTDY